MLGIAPKSSYWPFFFLITSQVLLQRLEQENPELAQQLKQETFCLLLAVKP